MELWLASIEPRVIDAWLAYQSVEPAAFVVGREYPPGDAPPGGMPGEHSRPTVGRMIDAREAARRMANRARVRK